MSLFFKHGIAAPASPLCTVIQSNIVHNGSSQFWVDGHVVHTDASWVRIHPQKWARSPLIRERGTSPLHAVRASHGAREQLRRHAVSTMRQSSTRRMTHTRYSRTRLTQRSCLAWLQVQVHDGDPRGWSSLQTGECLLEAPRYRDWSSGFWRRRHHTSCSWCLGAGKIVFAVWNRDAEAETLRPVVSAVTNRVRRVAGDKVALQNCSLPFIPCSCP